MSLEKFATRLPESKCLYIRYKATHTKKSIQNVVTEIIDFYQQHDSEFMAKFATLSPPPDGADSSEAIGNHQESGDEQ